ncbi:MAG TPA: VCBS repeat-containing protein, partial [Chloroflexota bacterium]|nr:VCBS repeat-containing protein [Chloroflexota bacterium]
MGTRPALYRGDGQGHFTDVTRQTGLDKVTGHFLGCAVGDYDNDGFPDIYLSGWNTGVLLHNEADVSSQPAGRRFRDVTREMGLQPQPWGTSCAFADVDGDGYLDLYVANYCHFDPKTDLILCPYHGVMTGCGPKDYDAAHGVLYHNEHGRGFRDVTAAWNVKGHGKALGVAFSRFEQDTSMGFALANDLEKGDLFRNIAAGKFKDIGAESGTGVDDVGDVHAGMGIDWGDYDNDGRPDLFVTTFSNEVKCLYHNDGEDLFTLASAATGLDKPTLPYVGWGCKFVDVDNDGWLDLVLANGHVQDNI